MKFSKGVKVWLQEVRLKLSLVHQARNYVDIPKFPIVPLKMKIILTCIIICLQLVNYGQSYDPKWSVGKCRRVFGQNCERKPSWFVCNCNSNCFSNNTLFLENSLPGTVNSPAACQIRCKHTKGCKVNNLILLFKHCIWIWFQ